MTDFLEKTLEDIVFENRETIHERGLRKFKDVGFRQFYLPSGKKIDLVCWDIVNGELYLDVYELKREIADISAICQGYDYLNEFIGLVEAGFKKVIPTLIIIGKNMIRFLF